MQKRTTVMCLCALILAGSAAGLVGGCGGSDPAGDTGGATADATAPRPDAAGGAVGGAGGSAGGTGGSGGGGGSAGGSGGSTGGSGGSTGGSAGGTGGSAGGAGGSTGGSTGGSGGGGGTPPPPPPASVVLNEVDCHGRDWIELLNTGDAPADLSGYGLTDDLDDPERTYRLPAGTEIAPGGFLDVRQQNENADGFQFGIGCGGDETIVLLDPAGELVDAVTLPVLADRYAWGRLPDGTGAFARTEPTRGAPNVPGALAGADYFDPQGRAHIDIELPPQSVNGLNAAPYEHVPARVRITVGQAEGADEGEWYDVGLHIKGRAGSFRTLDGKPALRIDTNRYVPGQDIAGLKNLTLNNMVQDPSIVHEVATYALFRALGIPAPRTGFASVTVNGQPYGLYLFLETYDDVWLQEHFETTVHLYEGLYGQDLYPEFTAEIDAEEGDPLDRSDYEALVMALDAASAHPGELLPRTEALIDWPQVARVMATELYVGHWDGYASTRNNWYMHFDADGVMRLLPWGSDQTWGYDHPLHQGGGRLFAACMADADCRVLYDQQIAAVLDAVDALDLPTLVQGVYAAQRPALEADPRKEYPIDHGDAALAGTVDFMRWRRDAVGAAVACLIDRVDPDGDGFFCDQDCGPDDPTTYPGAPDLCGDGLDQDCNGRPDDGFDCPDCQERWLGPHRYLVCPNPRDFDQAVQHCRDNGSELAQIDGPYENLWVWYNAVTTWNQWWWIGGHDRDVEGTFTWTTGAALDYRDFLEGQPDDGGGDEDCLHYFEWSYQWNDIACSAQLGVLCEDTCPPGQDGDGDGHLRCGDDCNDGDGDTHPGAPEVCRDFVDQNCDGVADEGQGCDCVEAFQGPHRYQVCHNRRTWWDARAYCQSMGMDLALVDARGENTFLANVSAAFTPTEYWLGHTDQNHEGNFTGWDDTERWNRNWADGEPNNAGGNEHCAHFLGGSDLWNDIPCDVQLAVICEETCGGDVPVDEDRDGVGRCGGDCDDTDRAVRPGAREVCGDLIDQDCSGVPDDDPRCR
jgi:hypothetical protein